MHTEPVSKRYADVSWYRRNRTFTLLWLLFMPVAVIISLYGCSDASENSSSLDGMEISATQCQDDEDNDGDGLVDCNDPDCQGFVFCTDGGSDTDANTDGGADGGTDCLEGNYVANNTLDLDFLSGFSCVTGSVTINAFGISEVSVPYLESIGGRLKVEDADYPTLISFSSLEYVGDGMLFEQSSIIEQDGTPTTIDFASLQTSLGSLSLYISNLKSVASASFPSLVDVNNIIFSWSSVENIDLSSLQTADSLFISGLGTINNGPNVPLLSELGDLSITDNDTLSSLGWLGTLDTVTGNISVSNNPSMPQCEACDLLDQITLSGNFSFSGNLDDSCSYTCD